MGLNVERCPAESSLRGGPLDLVTRRVLVLALWLGPARERELAEFVLAHVPDTGPSGGV